MKEIFTQKFRRLLPVFIFLLTAGIVTTGQNVPEYMYYTFDAAGNQTNYASSPVGTNPAVLSGLTVGSTGQFGTALIGNGLTSTSNRLNTGWATSLPNTGWTISFWLNNFPATSSTTYYYFGDANASSFRCFTGGVAGNGNLLVRGGGLTDTPINGIPATPTVIHLVYTGTALKVYFNGVYSSQVVQPTVAISGTGPFLVGGYSSSNSINSGTLMDEWRLYNRVLTDTEISQTWNQSLPLVTGPIVVTTAATAVTSTTATLNGTVNANNSSTTVTFEYGLTTAYGSVVAGVPPTVTGNTVTPVSAAITGLTPNTLYHYRVKGVNANGTANGSDMTFTTTVAPPAVVTTAATGIGTTAATLNGTVNANNASTTVQFEYGLTTAYGTTVAGVPPTVTGNTVTPVSIAITSLTMNTLYHYRVKGTNSGGTSNGNDMTFTTAGPPTVTTDPASNITATTATLNGTVNANGLSTTVTFEWGLTIAYGNTVSGVPGTVTGTTPTPVAANITGLVSGNTYHFRCKGVNAGGSVNGADQFFVAGCQAPVAAGAISGPNAVCASSTGKVYSVAPITNATGYAWTVPAGAVITAGQNTTSITVTFGTTSGNVTVAGTNACGNGTPSSLAVTVNPLPVPTVTGPASACQGTTTSVYTTQAGMTGYTWAVSAGGAITGGSTTNAITVTWNTAGAQNVSVNYTNASGCSALTPVVYNVTVNAAPVPTIAGQNSMCVNSGYYDYTTQAGFTNYTWTISSGGIITWGQGTNTAQVSWIQPGAQWIAVNYTNANGCSSVVPVTYAVNVTPVPGAAGTITGTAAVCGGANGISYSVAPVTGAVSYVWTLPAGATIASGNGTNAITVNFAASASSGNITVYGNNLCGNGTLSPNFAVTVTPLPGVPGTITGPSAVCQGDAGVVYSVSPVANATGYTWTVPSGATIVAGGTTNSITVDFSASASSGSVTVLGTNSCGNGPVSSAAVTVNPVPATPVVTAMGDTLTSSAPAGNQWYRDGVMIPGATGQVYIATATGWYWCVVTTNGCSSAESNHVYVVMTGVDQPNATGFSLYPVPNDGQFTVTITSGIAGSFTVEVYNTIGAKIHSRTVEVNGTAKELIDLRPVPGGVYTVVVVNSDTRMVKRFVVNR